MFSFQYGEGALRPYFSQAHHAPVGLTADPFMPSIKSRIATASKNSAPNARLLKAGSVSLAVFAGIPLHLITTQVFSGRLTAVQPLVDKLGTFRTTKCIFLGQIIKTILFRRIGKLDRGNVSGDAQQLQTTMNGTGIRSHDPMQCFASGPRFESAAPDAVKPANFLFPLPDTRPRRL